MRSRSHPAREAAYAEFVTARQTQLRRLAYARCGDWRLADDLLQAALTKLYVAWPRLERDGTEEAYVRRLLVRSRVRADESTVPGSEADRDPFLDAVLSLPSRQRCVLLLRHWFGLSDEETAEDLRISVGGVRAQLARAEASLPTNLATPTPGEAG